MPVFLSGMVGFAFYDFLLPSESVGSIDFFERTDHAAWIADSK